MKSILGGTMLALMSTTMAGAAESDYYRANGVLPGCKAAYAKRYVPERQLEAGYCLGVIGTLTEKSSVIIAHCYLVPSAITFSQAARVIVRYIEDRPQRMHESFVSLVIEAFHDAWPCQ